MANAKTKIAFVSIVIPLYNAEKYIEGCAAAVLDQSYGDWECIFVDDGSSDNGVETVRRIASRDGRFRLIQQANAGPGAARNLGLENALGEYFTFLDVDDIWHPHYLRMMIDAFSDGVDVVGCAFRHFTTLGEVPCMWRADLGEGRRECKAPLIMSLTDYRRGHWSPWGKLYRRSTLGHLRFPNLRMGEDLFLAVDCYAVARAMVLLDAYLYYVRITPGSLSRNGIVTYRAGVLGFSEVALHVHDICVRMRYSSRNRRILVRKLGTGSVLRNLMNAASEGVVVDGRDECVVLGFERLVGVVQSSRDGILCLPAAYVPLYLSYRCGLSRWVLALYRCMRKLVLVLWRH